jgi:hypothetical protein
MIFESPAASLAGPGALASSVAIHINASVAASTTIAATNEKAEEVSQTNNQS